MAVRFLLSLGTPTCLSGQPISAYPVRLTNVAISASEANYLIDETNRLFPRARLSQDDIVFAYAGTRPLPHKPRGSTGAITRRHLVKTHPAARGLFSVVGGKLTTYRATAADVTRRVEAFVAARRVPSSSRRFPVRVGNLIGRICCKVERSVSVDQLNALWYRYGTESEQVLEVGRRRRTASTEPGRRPSRAEIIYAFDFEWAEHLADVLFRRTLTAYDAEHREAAARAAADLLVALGRWSAETAQEELAAYDVEVRQRWGELQQNYAESL